MGPDHLARPFRLRRHHVDVERRCIAREDRLRLLDTLLRCDLPWKGHEGYARAEVTGGGVRLSDVDPRTMESRKQRGLFLCGELLDAFGPDNLRVELQRPYARGDHTRLKMCERLAGRLAHFLILCATAHQLRTHQSPAVRDSLIVELLGLDLVEQHILYTVTLG